MATVHRSSDWTGGGAMRSAMEVMIRQQNIVSQSMWADTLVSTPYVPPVAEQAKPKAEKRKKPYIPIKYQRTSDEVKAHTTAQLKEYSEVAAEVGVAPAGLMVEQFKAYLVESGMTVFSLKTVTAFMDEKSKHEGNGNGWQWLPLRDKDKANAPTFGRASNSRDVFSGQNFKPASDYFSATLPVYGHVVPLHALKKVAKIEREFPGRVLFAVSDYAPAPEFRVDPFLMVIVPNPNLHTGEGRFVIDVWDEPGFGIEQMLQSDIAPSK